MKIEKVFTAKDSTLTHMEIQTVKEDALQLIRERYWDFEEEVFASFVPALQESADLQLAFAQKVFALHEQAGCNARAYISILEQAIEAMSAAL